LKTRPFQFLLVFAAAGLFATAAFAHEAAARPVMVGNASTETAPMAARYVVTIERASSGQRRDKPQSHAWYFYRDAERVALLKGNVDEVWYRDAHDRISFERVFHDDARVVDYSTGELATLQVNADWAALSRFVDPTELAQLKLVSKQGKGREAQWHLRGRVGKEQLDVVWLPALELPQRLTRHVAGASTVQMQLVATAKSPQSDWPVVGEKSANYLHIDAADFGDMDYDPVVRKSEALDMRLGWRASHKHD
jgi:hypothetical protein